MQTILIHVAAPPKPPEGQACNGCGVCCLAQPCPLGIVLSGKRTGACAALQWDAARSLYRCGAVQVPREVVRSALPTTMRWLAPLLAAVLVRVARRWIAAGYGCDSDLEPQPRVAATMDTSFPSEHHD